MVHKSFEHTTPFGVSIYNLDGIWMVRPDIGDDMPLEKYIFMVRPEYLRDLVMSLLHFHSVMKAYQEREEYAHFVSRIAAALVLSAGGEVRVNLSTIRNVDTIRLHQREQGDWVIWSATPYDRADAGPVLQGRATAAPSYQPAPQIGKVTRLD